VATEVTEFFGISPNPFKHASAISYQLARASRVALSVYDVSGRLVKALSAGQELIEPGYYTVPWDGSDDLGRKVPAGVYFVKFETADHTSVQKAILLK
jgi:flagellar hook assembly protein FlgD